MKKAVSLGHVVFAAFTSGMLSYFRHQPAAGFLIWSSWLVLGRQASWALRFWDVGFGGHLRCIWGFGRPEETFSLCSEKRRH